MFCSTVVTAVIILEVVNKEKGVAGKYFDKKKVCLWTLITFSYRICVTITILERLASQIEWSYESILDDPGRRSKDALPGHLFLDFFAKHFPNYLSLHYKKNVWPNLVRAAKQSWLKRCSKWNIRNCKKQCKYLHH